MSGGRRQRLMHCTCGQCYAVHGPADLGTRLRRSPQQLRVIIKQLGIGSMVNGRMHLTADDVKQLMRELDRRKTRR